MKITYKDVIKPAFILSIVCILITGLITITNNYTKGTILLKKLHSEELARKVVLPEAEIFKLSDDNNYYIGLKNNNIIGYVFTTKAKGYAGNIKVMTGITKDKTISGIEVVSQEETPGLGTNATKKEFKTQFNQKVPSEFKIIKSGNIANGEIMAITGATITTNAIVESVNEAIKIFESIGGEN